MEEARHGESSLGSCVWVGIFYLTFGGCGKKQGSSGQQRHGVDMKSGWVGLEYRIGLVVPPHDDVQLEGSHVECLVVVAEVMVVARIGLLASAPDDAQLEQSHVERQVVMA